MRKYSIIIISILIAFLLVSCSPATDSEGENPGTVEPSAEPTATETPSEEPIAIPTVAPIPTPSSSPIPTPSSSDPVVYKSNTIEIVYTNPEDNQTYTETYEVGEAAGADAAIKAVNELILKGKFGDIGFNNVVKSGENIFIDFDDSIYTVAENPLLEQPSLEAIADAYLDNVEGVSAVYYTVNGEGYSSMNIEYGAGEPFKTK